MNDAPNPKVYTCQYCNQPRSKANKAKHEKACMLKEEHGKKPRKKTNAEYYAKNKAKIIEKHQLRKAEDIFSKISTAAKEAAKTFTCDFSTLKLPELPKLYGTHMFDDEDHPLFALRESPALTKALLDSLKSRSDWFERPWAMKALLIIHPDRAHHLEPAALEEYRKVDIGALSNMFNMLKDGEIDVERHWIVRAKEVRGHLKKWLERKLVWTRTCDDLKAAHRDDQWKLFELASAQHKLVLKKYSDFVGLDKVSMVKKYMEKKASA